MIDWEKEFRQYVLFSSNIYVSTKEKGWVRQTWGNKLLTQKLFSQNFFRMKKEGKSKIVVLKCRQSGISTEAMLVNLYFLQMFDAFQLSFMVHDAKYFGEFRSRYTQTVATMKRKRPIIANNNTAIRFANGSSILLYAVRTRNAETNVEGRSSSSIALHATEVAYYHNTLALDSIQASLPESNELRYLIYESSPNGENHFLTEYENARFSATSQNLFLAWWHHDLYKVDKRSKIFEMYAGESERDYAQNIQNIVREKYGFQIRPEQWAWYYWKLHETYHDDEEAMAREFPSSENEAWELTNELRCYNFEKIESAYEETPLQYKLKIKLDFFQYQPVRIKIFPSKEPTLSIWELPRDNAFYVVGADPTGAANPDSDNAVMSIWRVSQRKMTQVAELVDNLIPSDEFVFYLAFLCALYNGASYNVEVTGPGMNVERRMRDAKDLLKKMQYDSSLSDIQKLINENVRKIKPYLFSRGDAVRPSFASKGTKTSREEKELMTDILKGLLNSGSITIRSEELVDEMKNIERDTLSGRSGHKDDRVIAMLLAARLFKEIERRLPAEERAPTEEEQKENKVAQEMFYRLKTTGGSEL
jgi:hypothetical protein